MLAYAVIVTSGKIGRTTKVKIRQLWMYAFLKPEVLHLFLTWSEVVEMMHMLFPPVLKSSRISSLTHGICVFNTS